MGFGQSIKHVFGNYANFQGRASRSEFWWWYLFTAIVSLALNIITLPLGLTVGGGEYVIDAGGQAQTVAIPGVSILSLAWFLIILIPTIAVGARRLHDTDRSGWWWLLYPLCCIGPIILIIFWILPSTPGPNRFGEGPAIAI